jgi:FkbH-like protein
LENDEVLLKPDVLTLLKCLDGRGILLSIASKNDLRSTWSRLEQLGIAPYFLYPQINWGQKSDGIKLIAKSLNIGLDALAFVDDSPFELDEVARSLPMVKCVPASELHTLPGNPRFQGSGSADARSRRAYYQQAIQREQTQAEFGENYLGFLESSEIKLDVAYPSPDDFERISELVQRTNQLNFSGRKYSRNEVGEILGDENLEKLVLRCRDKYGSYGTIGFAIIRHCFDEIRVEDLMLSCRVQGKFIERSLFDHLLEHHNPHSTNRLWVNFTETGRNTPARKILEVLRFQPSEPGTGLGLDLSSSSLRCDFIQIRCSCAPAL